MGRRLIEDERPWHPAMAASGGRITLYAAKLGPMPGDASALRQALCPPVPPRTWHRVYPYLPRETLADGSLVLWHPDEAGWSLALEQVHRLCAPTWRLSGAYVAVRGTERVEMRDFHALDEIDLPDWSLAVPDPGFADMLGHLDGNAWRWSPRCRKTRPASTERRQARALMAPMAAPARCAGFSRADRGRAPAPRRAEPRNCSGSSTPGCTDPR